MKLCLGLLFASFLLPVALSAERSNAIDLSLRVESFRIVHISQQRIEAEINLSVTLDRNAQISRIDFANIHANGVPFFAQPVDAPIEVHRGKSLLLPPVSVAMYPTDLDSLEPLIAIVEEQKARLQAELSLRVQVTTLQHLFLGNGHPLAVITLDQPVEVSPPRGILGRASTMALLRVAQVALGGVDRLRLRASRQDTAWNAQLGEAQAALFHVHTCYTASQKKPESEVCVDGLAASLGAQGAVSAAELGTPWRFDPVLARTFAEQGGRLQTGDARITVQPLASAASSDLSDTGVSTPTLAIFQQVGDPILIKEVVLPGHSQVPVFARSSPGVYGRLRLSTATGAGAALKVAPDLVLHQTNWDELAIFRLVPDEVGGWRTRVVLLSGSADRQAITFSRPVDRSTLGSPILTPQGIIGVVQSEAGGTLLADSLPL